MKFEPPPLLPLPALGTAEPSAFARHAANACLAAPLLVIGFSSLFSSTLRHNRDYVSRELVLGVGLVAGGFLAIGGVLGILSIALAKPGQRGSVIPRVLGGFALIGLLIAIAVPNFVRARTLALENKRAVEEVKSAAADLRAQTVAALTNSQITTVDTRKLQQSLSRAAENTSGETSAILNSSQRYLAHIQSLQQAYAQAANKLTAAKVLAAQNLTQRTQIKDRKAIVQSFLEANDACKRFVMQGEANYRKELAGGGISREQTEAAVKGFLKNFAAQAPLTIKIREADDRMGRAMLGVLDLFDSQWDQWSYDADSHLVRFQDSSAVSHYNALMAQIKQAATEQAAAQERLAAAVSQSSASL